MFTKPNSSEVNLAPGIWDVEGLQLSSELLISPFFTQLYFPLKGLESQAGVLHMAVLEPPHAQQILLGEWEPRTDSGRCGLPALW